MHRILTEDLLAGGLFISLFMVFMLLAPSLILAGGGGGVGGFGGSLEITQIMNNIELADQSVKMATEINNQLAQIQQLLTMARDMNSNSTNIPNQIWGDTLNELNKLASIVKKGQAIAYSMGNIDTIFKKQFPGYSHWSKTALNEGQFSNQYNSWTTTNMDTIKGALEALGIQFNWLTGEDNLMRQLGNMSQNSTGRMQAIQVGNQIAAQEVSQLQKLRHLVMTQSQMQATYMATEVEKENLQQSARERLYNTPDSTLVGDGQRF